MGKSASTIFHPAFVHFFATSCSARLSSCNLPFCFQFHMRTLLVTILVMSLSKLFTVEPAAMRERYVEFAWLHLLRGHPLLEGPDSFLFLCMFILFCVCGFSAVRICGNLATPISFFRALQALSQAGLRNTSKDSKKNASVVS